MKTTMTLAAAAAAALFIPALATAQTAPAPAAGAAPATGAAPAAGATVYDTAGGVVGTIEQITPQGAVVSTGTNKVTVPLASLGTSPKGPLLAMTKAQLDAAADQAKASASTDLKTKLVPGTQVNGSAGTPVGTIKAADAQYVTLTTAKGDVKLPASGFGADASGKIAIGMTAAQLDAAIAGSTPVPAAAPAAGAPAHSGAHAPAGSAPTPPGGR